MTEPPPLQQVERTRVLWQNQRYSYFAGCDYFRLSSHPRVLAALRTGVKKFGLNVAASRMTTGNHALYEKLERALAKYFDAPAALLVGSGYATNAIVAQALRGQFARVFLDARAHASLRDASRQFDARVQTFRHRDPKDLSRLLARGHGKSIVLTDGLFGHNGETAPLADYLKVLPAPGLILVDDAHGAGVLGTKGCGTLEYAGVSRDRIIQSITLSKAFGVYGGAILCPRALREKMMAASPMFSGSTPLPLPLACAALQSVELLQEDPRLRRRLENNVTYAKSILRERGFPVAATPAPIIACEPGTVRNATALKRRLLARKIFPSLIHYPGAPASGYFRFTLSSEHTRAQIDDLLAAIAPTTRA